ncbi:MAG: bifunctional adenosylcobinamide kinase/adenosylcobinamide-phosphate guanylyltransferase [Eubacteriales bacterium]|nr:bifunctional adenosylcobinamide kinase/adenosylcobinamide-phosphate guanylyltransferase [Eubacteriales bacterium]
MITLITGGSGSGKSAYAEDQVLLEGEARRIYVATMYPYDKESHHRIERHRRMRAGKGFETVECYTNLKELQVPKDSVVLLECMSNLVANEMFQPKGAHERTVEEILQGVRVLEKQARHLFIVTNEIFSDSMEYEEETKLYQNYLGQINIKIARMAERVVEVVYGIPIENKKGQKKNDSIVEQF